MLVPANADYPVQELYIKETNYSIACGVCTARKGSIVQRPQLDDWEIAFGNLRWTSEPALLFSHSLCGHTKASINCKKKKNRRYKFRSRDNFPTLGPMSGILYSSRFVQWSSSKLSRIDLHFCVYIQQLMISFSDRLSLPSLPQPNLL